MKVKVNIGKHDFWINGLKRSRPQDAVVLDNERNGKFNFARMRYRAYIPPFSRLIYVGDIADLMSSKKRPVSCISQPSVRPLPNYDITVIRPREIVCDIHSIEIVELTS